MASNTLETPADFPDQQDVQEGDKKKFIVEVECTGKEDDGEMEWKVLSIDGVKLPEDDEDEESEEDNQGEDGVSDDYDESQDEPSDTSDEEDAAAGKPKSTRGIALMILHGKK